MTIRNGGPEDFEELVAIWLRSVRATHAFLSEFDIAQLLPDVREKALPALEIWILSKAGKPIGFAGLDGAKLEALFLDPEHLGQRGGRLLVQHARQLKGPLTVEVNEQNPEALNFCVSLGIEVVDRSPLDSAGRPFVKPRPICSPNRQSKVDVHCCCCWTCSSASN